MAIRFVSKATVKNKLPRSSNIWDGTAVFSPFTLVGNYDALATVTVGVGGVASVTFAGIPTTGYSHLQIRGIGLQATNNDVFIKVNTDAGVRQHYLMGNGATASAGTNTGTGDGQYFGTTGFASTQPTAFVIDLVDYANTNKAKTVRALMGYDTNGAGRVTLSSFLFTTTSAISSVTFTSGTNIAEYSSFALYGVKA